MILVKLDLLLVYYHGTNGMPDISLLQRYTEGSDFILIGMTYVRRGRFQYSEENLKDEMKNRCFCMLSGHKKTMARSDRFFNEIVI